MSSVITNIIAFPQNGYLRFQQQEVWILDSKLETEMVSGNIVLYIIKLKSKK